MPLNDWLTQFFSSRSLPAADGRPLYRYQMTDGEFASLQTVLRSSALLNHGWNRVFVIYAAEWWRREYDGSKPSWERVFTSFDASASKLSTTERNFVVETGLRYWRREIRKMNRRQLYLGTVAIEGGLPLNQLNNTGGWLGRVFKQIIPKYTRWQRTGTEASELIAECDYIPKTYQNPQIYVILGDMVKTVVELKQKHQLQERDNPILYLDQNHKDWRELFPLPIANDVAARLLSEMIITVAKADDTFTLPIQSIRSLRDDGTIQLNLEFAGFIALEKLGFEEAEKIPGRIDIELVGSDGKSRLLGISLKTEYKQKTSLKMPKPPAAIAGDAALQGYNIRFKHLSKILKEIPLIGGERLDNDVPWVFTQRDDAWILEGLASVSTRAKQVKILYPDHFRVDAEEYQAIATQLPNKKGISGTGRIRLTDDDGNTFIIKTAQEHSSTYYYLEGKTLRFETAPSEIYIGLPSVRRLENETGISKSIDPSKLFARAINRKSDWQLLSKSLQGVYDIRLCEQQAILFRKKCVLLPDDFAVRFKPSDNPLHGTIFLDCVGNAEVICETPIRHKISRENTGYRIELFAEQIPPSHVSLTFRWQGMLEMATLNLPFPARGGQIIDADGNKQSCNQPLFQDQLHGIRLRLFNERPDCKRHLQIRLNLADEKLAANEGRDIYFSDEATKQGSVIELAVIDYLNWIKSLLAVSGNLDSFVQLTVDENGSELCKVKIARYAFFLERNLAQGAVELSQSDHAHLACDTLEGIRLKAMRLRRPEEHIELEAQQTNGTPTGSWRFQPEKRKGEPWLIYPESGSSIALRPILWAVGYEEGQAYHHNPDTETLHSAVMIGHIKTRHTTIKAILAAMRRDFNHRGWNYLRQLWQHCPHLPLSSFDVWTLAVEDAQVLVALVLQMDTAFIEKLNAELPVVWELLPLNDWLLVYSAYGDYLRQVIDEDDLKGLLTRRIDNITAASPSLDVAAKLLKLWLCGESHRDLQIKSLPHKAIADMIKEQRQKLDRRQADSDWPTFMQSELGKLWQQLKPDQQLGVQLNNIADCHHAVTVLPLLLATYCAGGGLTANWLGNPTVLFKLKRLKTFDEDWFNTAFQWALAYLAQQNK